HRSRASFKFALLIISLVLTFAFAPVRCSSGQSRQNNRQLERDSSRSGPNERRTALIIGNGAYTNAPPLKNPPNDATLLSTTLKKLGFEVVVGTNRSQREMKQLIREFGQRLRTGGGVGLFYFAGHGIQSKGHNYLIPIDADIQTEADLEDAGVDVNYVLNLMDEAQNVLNIAILDACRNNPFARSFRSAQEGLAQVKAPTGTLIAYATAPDSVAADGGGANSPYAEELTKQMEVSGVLLETMFRRVTEQVSSRSGGRQEPWYSANVKGDFFFNNSRADSSLSETSSQIDPVAVEREYWETIRSSNDAQDYKDYLQAYPKGPYAVVARAKIRQIEAAKTVQPADSQPAPSNSGSDKSSDPNAIELSYWETIKSSIDPESFRKYLEKYPNGQFAGLAKRRMESARVLADRKTSNQNKSSKPGSSSAIPSPIIVFAGVESRQSKGKSISRYTFTVLNSEDYPVDLFVASPNLPPCGMNSKASRTWVDIFDAGGKRFYGFCALENLRGSGNLWFDLSQDVAPPNSIYIELTDRKTGKKYRSNLAPTQ
ncbi:MAG TPA: caspase family protein, partial [Pyrinomonadaceae bacterium]|nr:caspase family protein [Pyrinomonadaceae bacterium]